MVAKVAEFFGVGGEAGAEVGLFVAGEQLDGVGDQAEGVDVVRHELLAGPVLFVPFGVQAQEFGKDQGACHAQCAGAVEDFRDLFGGEIFDFGKGEADRADAVVFEIFARFDDFAGFAAVNHRGDHRRDLFDQAKDVISGHANRLDHAGGRGK